MVHTDVCAMLHTEVYATYVRMPIDFELLIIQVLHALVYVLHVCFPVSIYVLVLYVCIRVCFHAPLKSQSTAFYRGKTENMACLK